MGFAGARPFSDAEKRIMLEMHGEGFKSAEIAEALGTGRLRTTVYQWLVANYEYFEQKITPKSVFIKADAAFCARLEAAIAAGLERDPRRPA